MAKLKIAFDAMDYGDEMDALDARLVALSDLCIASSPQAYLTGNAIAGMGQLIFEYLEDKEKLEKKYWRKND
jgi:hypothetical protein